ncbi:MAG: glycosyltransferase, partial [Bacteroidetes bacterium]
MNITFATYHSVMLLKGGPKTQMLQSKYALEKLGVNVTLFDMWHELDNSKADLVHLFGANIGTFHFARELHRANIPFVVSPIFYTRRSHTLVNLVTEADKVLKNLGRGFWTDYGLIRSICEWAKIVLPNTTDEALLVEKGFGISKEKICVVPNGVEERFYHANPAPFQEKYGIKDFILNVGHIGPERKNVFRLIQALKTINHPAVIIGRIEDSDEARRCLSEAKQNPRITIIDYLPNDTDLLASAYAACDTFVLPGQFETPGIAALEAALAGAKIVITKHGGTKDYFGNLAEYVEPESVTDIDRGITAALHKP